MKGTKKSPIVLAIVFICIGLSLLLTSLLLSNFNLTSISSLQFTDVVHEISLPFEDISVEEIDCGITILPAKDGKCTVISQEVPNLFNRVSVEDGTLTVRRRDERAWHERILVFGAANPTLTVYLPKEQYRNLSLRTTAGEIRVEAPITFETATLKNVSGNVTLTSPIKESATLSATAGNVTAENQTLSTLTASTAGGNVTLRRILATEIKASTVSGDLRLDTEITVDKLRAESTSGSILFTDVTAIEELTVTEVSGSITLLDIEFADAYVETVSGNVIGTLRTEKRFDVQTTSGVVLHPASDAGALLRVRTVSGNVSFTFISDAPA